MLKLKNVSKFYYSKGVIASGFSKVNIEFNLGEFVAIIGESGSGKSTLLNVISGLDSYEEGEMYINGEETSHYREIDFEEYRKKYVSNIFQNFNLVNSYTVYQNIELVLLINGHKKKEVKAKVLELIDKVKLKKYKNTKVSKLSGGQKQRVAIARALAKDTPIIACDEPTASLDSKSAQEVINTLKEVSKDKLVIVVTHNFAEVENIATRIVKMHDGKIVSDKYVDELKQKEEIPDKESKSLGLFNMIRLGIRNTFNIIPKFLLIFFVFLFITTSLLSVYGSLKKSEYEEGKIGSNYFFSDTRDTRIIIKKKDNTAFTEEDFTNIKKLNNIKSIAKNDIMLDSELWFESNDDNPFYFSGTLQDIGDFEGQLDYGRMPEKDNEVIILIDNYDYYFNDKLDEALAKTYYLNGDKNNISVKITGVKYKDETLFTYNLNTIYVNEYLQNAYMKIINRDHSIVQIKLNNKNYASYYNGGGTFDMNINSKVPTGCAYVSENMSYACKNYECKNKTFSVHVKNLYYEEELNLKICNVYTDKNAKNMLGVTKEDYTYGGMFINPNDYDKLFNKDSYQASVIANHVDNVDTLSKELESMGYNPLEIRKTLTNEAGDILKVIKIMKLVVIILLVITLFFISYFVIKLILKSRNVYYSTLRILGANLKHIKRILDIELFTNATIAYLFYIVLIILVKHEIIYIKTIANIIDYLKLSDYIIMYIILIFMSFLISTRYARKIFKKSAMKTYREEV